MTFGAIESTLSERKLFLTDPTIPTFTTGLRSVGRIYSYEGSASFFRFASHHSEKGRPCRITNALGEVVIFNHPVNCQILNQDCAELINYSTGKLMGKVCAFPASTFMATGNRLTSELAFGRTFGFFRQSALNFSQMFFFFAKEAGISNLLTVTHCGKGFEAHVNADSVIKFWQNVRLDIVTRETSVPFAGTGTGDRGSFRCTLDGTVKFYFDITYFGNYQPTVFNLATGRGLGESQAIVAAITFEARVSNFLLTGFNSTEESFHSEFQPDGYILQNLGMDIFKRWAASFKSREFGLLVIHSNRFTGLFVKGSTFIKPKVIQPPAIFQLLIKQGSLLAGGEYSVFERFLHKNIIANPYTKCNSCVGFNSLALLPPRKEYLTST